MISFFPAGSCGIGAHHSIPVSRLFPTLFSVQSINAA